MSLEDELKKNTAALIANTAALEAASDEPGAKPAKKAKKTEEPDDSSDDTSTDDDLTGGDDSTDEPDLTEQVLAAGKKAIAVDRDAVQAVLKKLKVKKISELEPEQHAQALKLFKAIK